MKAKRFVAEVALGLVLSLGPLPAPAGIPVIDAGNLTQNIMTAMESVAQTLKQIEQYQTQLRQYENQLQNTLAPAAYIWDAAQTTLHDLLSAIDTLEGYQRALGSLDAYLGTFQDVAYYRASPCFSASGCSEAERAALAENRRLASESQKKANDALLRGLDRQQAALKADAHTLEQLQSQAQTARGQMQAIQYANQLASHQAHQLLQIRGLLLAQHNAIATRMQAQADREARETAIHEVSTSSRGPSSLPANPKKW